MTTNQKRAIFVFIGTLTALSLLWYVYVSDPHQGPILPCFFYSITGYYCPGCGMTRALNALMHANVKAAFAFNSLIFILLPLFILYGIQLRLDKQHALTLKVMLLISVVFAILRNTPAFSFLAP